MNKIVTTFKKRIYLENSKDPKVATVDTVKIIHNFKKVINISIFSLSFFVLKFLIKLNSTKDEKIIKR